MCPGPITAMDFFSGCGGTALGFSQAGIRARVAIDIDRDALETYAANLPEAVVMCRDVRSLAPEELSWVRRPGELLLFSACAPCQPFSRQRRNGVSSDEKASLIWEMARFIQYHRPELIFLENVPGMAARLGGRGSFADFTAELTDFGYQVSAGLVDSRDYGVPQRRKRFLVMASRLGRVNFPEPTHGLGRAHRHVTVRDAIGNFPTLVAGEGHPDLPDHEAMALSALNLRRIRATPEGGSRAQWPADLMVTCHGDGYRGHTDVYGRMAWDAPATGLTTRCLYYSCGRFGHPEQDRAISAREAAALQAFPEWFQFRGSLESRGRQIGNAVPVALAEAFGRAFVSHALYRRGETARRLQLQTPSSQNIGCSE